MKPKLILTDLDGTLLDEEKRVSAVNRAALERAAAQGAEIVVSTGRFPWGMPRDVEQLPFLRPLPTNRKAQKKHDATEGCFSFLTSNLTTEYRRTYRT